MNSSEIGRAPACGRRLLAAAPSVRAESTFDIPPGAHFNPDKLAKVGAFFRNEVDTGKIAGAIVLIQQHGKPVYHQSFGVQDAVSKAPITDQTIFRLFSMSKAISSVVAMTLIENGKIKLKDPVSKNIPSFAAVNVGVAKIPSDDPKSLELVPPRQPHTFRDPILPTSVTRHHTYAHS